MTRKEKRSLRKIYVFGNSLLTEDSLAIRVSDNLKKSFLNVSFIHLDPNEEIKEKNLILLDVAKGIKKVEIITDLDKLILENKYSLHDYDLAFNLKLLKKIGSINSVKIIAIPVNYNLKKAIRECQTIISSTIST